MNKPITLYYRQGGSDKVYQVGIQARGDGYVVDFAYGRRGTTLQTGTKTPAAVDLADATRILDKLMREKIAKGYTVGETGTPYQGTDGEAAASGILPQLLNPVAADELDRVLDDPGYCMQEKFDGKRLLIQRRGDTIRGINRRGLLVGLPSPVVAEIQALGHDVVIDGEVVGSDFHAFDLLAQGDVDVRLRSYRKRWQRLADVLTGFAHTHITPTPTAFTADDKRALYANLHAAGAEGVVFKNLDAPYTAGRPATGGDQLKHKFYATASFVVDAVNGRRSVALTLLRAGSPVAAGNVTIPPNHDVPGVGAVVEVRYLYAYRESGSIYQPVYLGTRDDIAPAECVIEQLKYKAGDDAPLAAPTA